MARFTRNQFLVKTKRDPFELELSDGSVVVFPDPNKLPAEEAMELASAEGRRSLEILLQGDFESFWKEWAVAPADELDALTSAVIEHFRNQ